MSELEITRHQLDLELRKLQSDFDEIEAEMHQLSDPEEATRLQELGKRANAIWEEIERLNLSLLDNHEVRAELDSPLLSYYLTLVEKIDLFKEERRSLLNSLPTDQDGWRRINLLGRQINNTTQDIQQIVSRKAELNEASTRFEAYWSDAIEQLMFRLGGEGTKYAVLGDNLNRFFTLFLPRILQGENIIQPPTPDLVEAQEVHRYFMYTFSGWLAVDILVKVNGEWMEEAREYGSDDITEEAWWYFLGNANAWDNSKFGNYDFLHQRLRFISRMVWGGLTLGDEYAHRARLQSVDESEALQQVARATSLAESPVPINYRQERLSDYERSIRLAQRYLSRLLGVSSVSKYGSWNGFERMRLTITAANLDPEMLPYITPFNPSDINTYFGEYLEVQISNIKKNLAVLDDGMKYEKSWILNALKKLEEYLEKSSTFTAEIKQCKLTDTRINKKDGPRTDFQFVTPLALIDELEKLCREAHDALENAILYVTK